MEGRRFGEGQHQAIEAKENVDSSKPENQTLASQLLFKTILECTTKLIRYDRNCFNRQKAEEFSEIYKLPGNLDQFQQM